MIKNSTEYLFGVSKDFFEPELSIVAKKKIVTAQMVKSNISKLKDLASKEELPELIARYQAADDAYNHWTKILGEKK